jgi:hypothetical protein
MGEARKHMNQPDYDFLQEEAPAEVVVELTPEPAATVATPEPPAPVVPTTTVPTEERVPLAALRAEREKRQQYERELAELRQKAQAPEPNFYEAPEQYVQQATHRAQSQMTQVLYAALEEAAREQYSDYDEILGEVNEAAQGNPLIRQQVFNSPNPAVAAYKLGKQLRTLKSLPDAAAHERAIAEAEARGRAKALEEITAKEAAKAQAAAAIPPDLSAVRSAVRDTPAVEDDSLESILASKKR